MAFYSRFSFRYNFKMIKRLIFLAERAEISIPQWMVGFAGVVFIRFFLESISNPSWSGIVASDAGTLMHYGIFYLATALGLMCIVGFFAKGWAEARLVLFGLPIIWLAPILDFLFSAGRGARMAYLFDAPRELVRNFLTYFSFSSGITSGIRIEVLIVLFFIGYYVWIKRRSIVRALGAVFASYLFIFILLSLPSFIYLAASPFVGAAATSGLEVVNYIQKSIDGSLIPQNMIHGMLSIKTYSRAFELGFNKFISQFLYLASIFLLGFWFWKTKREKFIAVIKNSRPERLAFFSALVGVGVVVAGATGNVANFNWVDVIGALCLIISFCAAFIYAVHVNDEEDVLIDEISNSSRPIVAGSLTKGEMRDSGLIWLAISLFGAYFVGYYAFFLNLVFHAAYYIYSASPLRLKRVPILSSFLISVAALTAVMSGFFWISADKKMDAFPTSVVFGVLIMMTLASNARDIKDVEGDRRDGIMTLPVIFGNNGIKITGMLLGLSFLLVPIFFSNYYLYILALPAGFWAYKLATKKPYKEIYIFILFFVFFVLSLFLASIAP